MSLQGLSQACPSGYIYNFIFHPLSDEHSPIEKGLALITVVALSILSCGVFLFLFAYCQWKERQVEVLPQSPAAIQNISCGRVEHGVNLSCYPARPKGENVPEACSCLSAAAIFYFSAHLDKVISAFRSQNTQEIASIHRQIIDRGLVFWNQAQQNGGNSNGLHIEELQTLVPDCKNLQLIQSAIITGLVGDIEEELDKIFSSQSNQYALIQAGGQCFLLFRLNENQAYLFDPHRTWAAVVSKDEAKAYIEQKASPFGIYSNQCIDFFHGRA